MGGSADFIEFVALFGKVAFLGTWKSQIERYCLDSSQRLSEARYAILEADRYFYTAFSKTGS